MFAGNLIIASYIPRLGEVVDGVGLLCFAKKSNKNQKNFNFSLPRLEIFAIYFFELYLGGSGSLKLWTDIYSLKALLILVW